MSSSRSILQIRLQGIVVVGYVSRVLREKIADDLVDRVVAFLLERIIHSGKRALHLLVGLVYQTEFSRSVKHIWFSFPILPVGVYRYLQHNTKSRKSKALSAQNSHENFFRLWHTLYGKEKGDGVLRAVIFQQPRQLLCVIERNAVRKCLLLGGWQRACVDACAQD